MQKHAMPEPFSKCLKGSENLLTVKIVYTHLPDGIHGTNTGEWEGNLISALAYFRPGSVIELDGEETRVDVAYIWPGGLSEQEALKVWKQTGDGLSYSMTGIGGPYTATAEGWETHAV